MIKYSLKCANDHGFESWFQSAAAYDALNASGQVTCPECGEARVEKALMAPSVPSRREAAIARLRREVEANSDYVGSGFAAEARRIHEGDAPQRSIYGEARIEDARALIEDGVPVAPLPFMPARRTN